MNRLLPTLLTLLGLVSLALPAPAAFQFATPDGGKATVAGATFHLNPTSATEPAFHGAELGVFSPAEGQPLHLDGFAARTLESGGHAIFSARVHYRVRPATATNGAFASAAWNTFEQIDPSTKIHSATNLHLDLIEGLAPGRYALDLHLSAQGNFSPDLLLDQAGTNYTAHFDIVSSVLDQPAIPLTGVGKTILSFTTVTNAGFGNEVYVVGSHPDVGSWNPLDAVKLTWTPGNVWTGRIAVASGTPLEFKTLIRTNDRNVYCDAGNAVWPTGDNQFTNVPALPAPPYPGKTVFYHSAWTNLSLVYQSGADTNWYTRPLTRVGDGRSPTESLYRVDGIGLPGDLLTFVITGFLGGSQQWDNTPVNGLNDYATPLDVLFLQDGHVHNHVPPATGSASRIEPATFITSDGHPTIPSRNIRVYLPRNYDQNTDKRYPVLYFHDGQNMFDPGGPFGTWSAEHTADDLISLGQMREAILVGVDNTSERIVEYIPPGDDVGSGNGTADQYGAFLINNVKPYVDANYRTLPDPDNTLTAGSSLGGLVSAYLGLTTSTFGKIGAVSPSYWAAPNFVAAEIDAGSTLGLRIYMDAGTGENSMWETLWNVNNLLVQDGYVHNHDLRVRIGCGQGHNEAAWAARLPQAYRFLLDIRDEPTPLAQQTFPPVFLDVDADGASAAIVYTGLKGHTYTLDQSDTVSNPAWSGVATSTVETLPWSLRPLEHNVPGTTQRVYRIRAANE